MSTDTPSPLDLDNNDCSCKRTNDCGSTASNAVDKGEMQPATDTTDALGAVSDNTDGILSLLSPFKKKQQDTGLTEDDTKSIEMCNVNDAPPCCDTNSSQTNNATPSSTYTRLHEDEDEYDFSHPERGYAVIIVNEDFDDPDSKRDGAQHDLKKMKYIAQKLGFKVFNDGHELNLNKKKTLKILREAQQFDHSNFDCFTLMISTHGMEEQNARANGRLEHALECADNQLVFTSSILAMFNEENCPSLKNKPKLFFIQACRGENVDDGCEQKVSYMGMQAQADDEPPDSEQELLAGTNDEVCEANAGAIPTVTDNHLTTKETAEQPDSKPTFIQNFIRRFKTAPTITTEEVPSLRPDTEQLVMYSIPESQFAWRSTVQGSWMIHYLHAVLEDHDLSSPRSLPALLTAVTALMAMRETSTDDVSTNKKKAVSVMEHRLTRDIVFREKKKR